MNMQEALRELQQNTRDVITQARVNVPDEIIGNPQAMVKHLLQTGQVGQAVLQKLPPVFRQMIGK